MWRLVGIVGVFGRCTACGTASDDMCGGASAEVCALETTLEQTYALGPDVIVAIAETQLVDGTPLWVAVDQQGHPKFVGYNVLGSDGRGFWTATVDYVYDVGGSCVSP